MKRKEGGKGIRERKDRKTTHKRIGKRDKMKRKEGLKEIKK